MLLDSNCTGKHSAGTLADTEWGGGCGGGGGVGGGRIFKFMWNESARRRWILCEQTRKITAGRGEEEKREQPRTEREKESDGGGRMRSWCEERRK